MIASQGERLKRMRPQYWNTVIKAELALWMRKQGCRGQLWLMPYSLWAVYTHTHTYGETVAISLNHRVELLLSPQSFPPVLSLSVHPVLFKSLLWERTVKSGHGNTSQPDWDSAEELLLPSYTLNTDWESELFHHKAQTRSQWGMNHASLLFIVTAEQQTVDEVLVSGVPLKSVYVFDESCQRKTLVQWIRPNTLSLPLTLWIERVKN